MARSKRRDRGEGGVTQRKDGRWAASFYDAEMKRRYVYGPTKQKALEKLRKSQRDCEQGILVDGSKVKLGAFLSQWLEEVKRPDLRISSYEKYRKTIKRYILPTLGEIQLQKLIPQNVQSLYTKMRKSGLSPKTIQSVHSILHGVMEHAVKWNLVARNVIDRADCPSVEKHEIQPLDLAQARCLLDTVRGGRLEMILTLALTTGMRRGELLALRWSDIDFSSNVLTVRGTVDYIAHYGYVETKPKTKKSYRKIVLPVFTMEKLVLHRAWQTEQCGKVGEGWCDLDLVFCGLKGSYFNPRYLLKLFGKALKEAGLSHIRFHDLRHSVVTLLLALGVDARSIQELVGHEDIETTLGIYGHVLPSMQQSIADKLGGFFS